MAHVHTCVWHCVNTLRAEQNGDHFAANIFKCIFLCLEWKFEYLDLIYNEACSSINNISSLVQVMAWHQTGAKPLPESMKTKVPDAIWHRWPQLLTGLYVKILEICSLKQTIPSLSYRPVEANKALKNIYLKWKANVLQIIFGYINTTLFHEGWV